MPASGKRWRLARKFFAVSVICAAAVVMGVLRPPGFDLSGIDLSKVHPVLLNLRQPCHGVFPTWYPKDGGMGLIIRDRDVNYLKLAMILTPPENKLDSGPYPKLFMGTARLGDYGGLELPCTGDDRKFIGFLIDHYGEPGPDRDLCLRHLRNAPRDRLRLWFHTTAFPWK